MSVGASSGPVAATGKSISGSVGASSGPVAATGK